MSNVVKILHTSDWHLGKRLYRLERLAEQEKFLDWLLIEIKQKNIDLLIIAGDIFDVPSPPHTAIKLFYNFIAKLESLKCHSLIISGNHDSGHLVAAITPLINRAYTTIIGSIDSIQQLSFVKEINGVKVGLSTLPFFRLHQINKLIEEETEGIIDVLDKFIEKSINQIRESSIKIFVGHHLFGSFMASGSEQTLLLSEIDAIPLSLFKDRYDYLALGHIHKPQIIKRENPKAVYSGSPIPMRFSEKEKKSMQIITHSSQETKYEEVIIPKFRELIEIKLDESSIEQTIDQYLQPIKENELDAVIEVNIFLKKPIAGIYERIESYLKAKYADVVILSFKSHFQSEDEVPVSESVFKLPTTIELFEHFYLYKYPEVESIPNEILENFKLLLDQLQQQAQEDETQ